jgi:hypothetical protein
LLDSACNRPYHWRLQFPGAWLQGVRLQPLPSQAAVVPQNIRFVEGFF